ncbi:hypothetical protein ASD8599_00522 [Ascidiaceihabitans donghaensis]|uniref:T6SS Phospholipase effector Tle1-like catalytic domain-containing protein n=1 Tax=Ascidiaceihabitans donghaensis TaxID=1510460 RepID=A0A2R8B9Q2_9RHOB|nr:DUF2235 domain-containing protein [Ascidiaceihabitans donghaensis]SPH19781.1 hypothetical protein ASD8599_00522 [Ascidiaceihabitans donghaensis]
MTDPVAANQTASAAGDEAGAGSADSIAISCDLIRYGVFFDGTNNSRDHTALEDIAWHTNVDLLERIYEETESKVTREVDGQTREVNYGKEYFRGIGVEAGGGTTTNGSGRGMGAEGVRTRVEDAVNQLRGQIRAKANGMEVCDLWFDVFGFSRGSAAARHFANLIEDGELGVQEATARVKFLGIYDTVVMIGFGIETSGADDNVRVETRNVADQIVHITADDEIRENFPLTLALSGKRYRMVGAHSDIGGGYDLGTETGTFEFEHEDYTGLPGYLSRNWGLTGGSGAADSESPDTMTTIAQSRWQIHDAGESLSTFSWSAEHGLQFVSLKLMYDEAKDAGVPFEDWSDTIDGIDVGLGGGTSLLKRYYDALKANRNSVDSTLVRDVRLRHAHVSFNNETTWGVHVSLPRESGRRLVATR